MSALTDLVRMFRMPTSIATRRVAEQLESLASVALTVVFLDRPDLTARSVSSSAETTPKSES